MRFFVYGSTVYNFSHLGHTQTYTFLISLARKFEDEFFVYMVWLRVSSFSRVACAHDFVDAIVNQVSQLIDAGFMYRLDDGWYYDLPKAPDGSV